MAVKPLQRFPNVLLSEVSRPLHNKAERRLRHPRPGSAIEAARDFGIDLILLIERLQLTPEERLRELQQAMPH